MQLWYVHGTGMPQSEQQFGLELTNSNASLSPSGSLNSLSFVKVLSLP